MELTKTNYVDEAEKAIKKLSKNNHGDFFLTTNQIRNLLTMSNELYAMIQHNADPTLNEDVISHIQYVKMRFAYAAGKDEFNKIIGEKPLKEFFDKTDMLNQFDKIKNSREKLMIFCHYMESLVAYHKFYGKNN